MPSTFKENIKLISLYLSKADGKDKLCATIQYACLFACAGEPGKIKKVQASVAAARKVFRILKPLESLFPLVLNPGWNDSTPKLQQFLNKIKALCMATYFAFDHVAWMGNTGLMTDTIMLKKCQKVSLLSWFAASCCTIAHQCSSLSHLLSDFGDPVEVDLSQRRSVFYQRLHSQVIILIHACLQTTLALGLLQYTPFGSRTIGLIGTLASVLNVYMLFPKAEKPKSN